MKSSKKKSGDLGTKNNPFVVLEIVPNMSMAQFGYLVSGQEPIDIKSMVAADDGTNAAKLSDYLKIEADKKHEVKEFSSIVTAVDWSYTYKISGTDTKKTVYFGDFIWTLPGTGRMTQYGTFERSTEADSDYVLREKETATYNTIGYAYVKVTDPTDIRTSIEKDDFESLSSDLIMPIGGENMVEDRPADAEKFVSVAAGIGVYSSEKYDYVGGALTTVGGEYSMEFKNVGDGLGDHIFEEVEEMTVYYSKNYMVRNGSRNGYDRYDAKNTIDSNRRFVSGGYLVKFKKKTTEKNVPTYNVKIPAVNERQAYLRGSTNNNESYDYYNRYKWDKELQKIEEKVNQRLQTDIHPSFMNFALWQSWDECDEAIKNTVNCFVMDEGTHDDVEYNRISEDSIIYRYKMVQTAWNNMTINVCLFGDKDKVFGILVKNDAGFSDLGDEPIIMLSGEYGSPEDGTELRYNMKDSYESEDDMPIYTDYDDVWRFKNCYICYERSCCYS